MARRSPALTGRLVCPGDKSMSHRALMFGAMASGQTRVEGLLEGEDVLQTAAAMRALGADIRREDPERGPVWTITGCGVGGFTAPTDVLDMGNSGTGARLLAGLLAACPFRTVMTGDASLRSRPMGRVTRPLSRMGAQFHCADGDRLPMTITGTADVIALDYESPVASAQVKSAILLAGLHGRGATSVTEPAASRDHTERMLQHFGASVETEDLPDGRYRATVQGGAELSGQDVVVPGDPSSAAFATVAALITPGSDVVIENVGLNPLRAGLFTTLEEMGADITQLNAREQNGEPVADLQVRGSALKGVAVPADRAPSMIDEYPILAVAAACAEGETVMEGLAELRVKESDRLAAMADGLAECGLEVMAGEDSLRVTGRPGQVPGGAVIASQLDHRIAMSFLVLGGVSENPIGIDDARAIQTSYPAFQEHMASLGAVFSE